MGETSIEWCQNTDGTPGYTFNPWWGCTRVSPGCDHCYAATWAKRWGSEWGASAPPRQFGDAKWAEPLRWDRAAAKAGIRARVFCASMADVFERRIGEHGAAMDAMRERLWALIGATPNLDWLLLTKRPENVLVMIPSRWRVRLPRNVWMGATAENQEQADKRIPHLLRVPARVLFLSCEPLLGLTDLEAVRDGSWFDREGADYCNALTGSAWWSTGDHGLGGGPRIGWVIAGGESGPGARPSHPDWFRSLRDQCEAAGVPFFFKQWGKWVPQGRVINRVGSPATREAAKLHAGSWYLPDGTVLNHASKPAAGRLLDGREHNGMPGGCPVKAVLAQVGGS